MQCFSSGLWCVPVSNLDHCKDNHVFSSEMVRQITVNTCSTSCCVFILIAKITYYCVKWKHCPPQKKHSRQQQEKHPCSAQHYAASCNIKPAFTINKKKKNRMQWFASQFSNLCSHCTTYFMPCPTARQWSHILHFTTVWIWSLKKVHVLPACSPELSSSQNMFFVMKDKIFRKHLQMIVFIKS